MAKEPIQKGLTEEPLEGGKPDHIVDAGKDLTAKRALALLKSGTETKKIDIAGKEIVNPKIAYEKLQEALKLVKVYFKSNLKIDLNDIKFRQFHGNMVGESTKEGTYIDPVMLMHPAMRLAHVISHELAHKNKKIMNEGVVEGYVDQWFGNDGAEHKYEEATEKFKEFAKKCDGKGDVKAGSEKLYGLYYRGKFEEMYNLFEKNYLSELKTEEEKDKAFELFQQVFPELDYVSDEKRDGYFDLKKIPEPRAANDNIDQVDEGAEVIDLASRRVQMAEEQVRKKRA